MKIGLIGCGNIGRFLLESLNIDAIIPRYRIEAVLNARGESMEEVAKTYQVNLIGDIDSFLASDLDLIIEAANIQAVRDYAVRILEKGKDMLMISVGALADEKFYEQIKLVCRESGSQIYLPSGAIGGLDVIKAAASLGQLDSVSITTRKPPKALMDEPVETEKVLFDGSAGEAIAKFPKNINVAIILSLVGLGAKKTNVKIIADPTVEKNNHSIEASGAFGKLKLQVENDPMPQNPKTSYLAALSILSTLQNQSQCIHIG